MEMGHCNWASGAAIYFGPVPLCSVYGCKDPVRLPLKTVKQRQKSFAVPCGKPQKTSSLSGWGVVCFVLKKVEMAQVIASVGPENRKILD